ncbi:AGAP007955-PA-like protein [Anopheles sinensis]|uniref:AGAP007955-PA-like protein n=1 Tax=Anopheles sinensis TaxID=74873 RepID=A0A084WHC3_ANOSI|nr:AGAP007955-PA-like protein [Anopheles sinensis]
MRSRTEMVTTTLDGSDFEEDSDFEDSEEDWKPEKGDPKGLKRKTRDIITGTVSGGRRGSGGRSSNGKKRGRKPAAKGRAGRKRKSGNLSDDDDDEDEDDDEDDGDDDHSDSDEGERTTPRARKRGRPSGAKGAKRSNGRKSLAKTSPSTSKAAAAAASGGGELAVKPIPRKVVNLASSFPDKSGFLKLYAYRGDLEEGIRDNLKVCLWRRDGSSLLQKYFRDKSADASSPQFISSMVYSCWEDKRSDEYMEVKVRCIEQSKQLRVQIYDADTIEKKAKEEYEKFIVEHGKPILTAGGAGNRTNGNGSRSRKKKRAANNDTEDDEEDTAEEEEELEEEQEDEEGGGEGAPEEEDDEANADRLEEECEEPPQEE